MQIAQQHSRRATGRRSGSEVMRPGVRGTTSASARGRTRERKSPGPEKLILKGFFKGLGYWDSGMGQGLGRRLKVYQHQNRMKTC